MKRLFASLLFVAVICGCTTPNPEHVTNPSAPAYIADTASISNNAFLAHGFNQATVPFNPYAPVGSALIEAGAGLAVVISGIFAKVKSDKAKKQEAAGKALAAALVQTAEKSHSQEAVNAVAMKIASGNGSSAEVAAHLDNANSPT